MRIANKSKPLTIQYNHAKHHLNWWKDLLYPKDQRLNNHFEVLSPLKKIGNGTFDLYIGKLGVHEVLSEIHQALELRKMKTFKDFTTYLSGKGPFYFLLKIRDDSEWHLRLEPCTNPCIHLFPARNSFHTLRCKANTLKMAIYFCILHPNKDNLLIHNKVQTINKIRQQYLNLPPVKSNWHNDQFIRLLSILNPEI